MNAKRHSSWRTDLRIVWAITAKDILEAVKNKAAFSVVIIALFVAIAYSFIPTLTSLDNPTNVLVYDAVNSPLSAQLKESQVLEVYTYPSEAMMLEKLAHGEVPELGLVIPADFSRSLTTDEGSQKEPELTGYVLYWVNDKEIARLTQAVEAEISRLAGKPVQIRVAEERLIPNPDQHSLGNWVGAALVFLLVYIGVSLIANLMLEEKQTHTLEALLVSPAGSWHVVMAKALTGLFYCLLGVAVTLAINQKIVLHWWLIIPVLVIGALFSISLGLIAGSLIEERGQLALWTGGLMLLLIVPAFLSLMGELFPQWLNQAILLIPTVTLLQLLLASFSVLPPASTILVQFAWLTAWAVAGLAGAVWLLYRQQQKDEGDQKARIRKVSPSLRFSPRLHENPAMASRRDAAELPYSMSAQAPGQGTLSARPASGLRIVQIIAAKDIRQSIHNKVIITILLGSALLVAGNAVLLRALSTQTGSPADLMASSTPVLATMISMTLLTLLTLGVALVPLLMVEEKEAHTMEVLLVSPARYMQVVAGKALAGAVFCLSGVLVILIAYRFLFVHWELALLAMLLGTAFVVALGLLVGMVSKNPATIGMWAAVIILILVIPTVLVGLGSLAQVPWAEAMMAYWPSTAIIELFKLAMAVEIPQGAVMRYALVVISVTIALYLMTGWLVRNSDH